MGGVVKKVVSKVTGYKPPEPVQAAPAAVEQVAKPAPAPAPAPEPVKASPAEPVRASKEETEAAKMRRAQKRARAGGRALLSSEDQLGSSSTLG